MENSEAESRIGELQMTKLLNNKRITFSFPNEELNRIDSMKSDFEVSTTTDVIKQSLTIVEYISHMIKTGNEIVIRNKNGEEKPLEMLFGAKFAMQYGGNHNNAKKPRV